MSLDLVVSPYHMTTREAPAMVALLLADRVVTLLPAPSGSGGRSHAERLASRAPRYASLVDSWRWSVPLWNEGIVRGELDDDKPDGDVAAIHAEIFNTPSWSSLRVLLEHGQHDSEPAYLEALAHDLLRGGPDPALTIPVAAGLDRFASRHKAMVCRSTPTSIAQKLEMRSVRQATGITIPVLLQGRGERLLDARVLLAPELDDLRDAIIAAKEGGGEEDRLRDAASFYRSAFTAHRAAFDEDDRDEVRVVTGEVSIRLVELSSDAALHSSEQATRSPGRVRQHQTAPGLTVAAGRTASLVVRVIGSH